MYCPNCSAFYETGCTFCGRCGGALISDTPPKKGSHWVPVLIMVVLSLLGIVLFFATAEKIAVDADMPWFEMTGKTLRFDDSKYNGPSELRIPDRIGGQTVAFLESGCFADCDELTTVILPEGLEAISWCAFDDCNGLRGIYIPESVTFIDDYAFAGCTALEAICIPASVTEMGFDAFLDCGALRHVFYGGTYEQWLELSGDEMGPKVTISCTDGKYCQGIPIP